MKNDKNKQCPKSLGKNEQIQTSTTLNKNYWRKERTMRPVCVKCGKEMCCERNGVLVVHLYERPRGAPEKTIGDVHVINLDYAISPDHFDCGRVDFVVSGDRYKCLTCGNEIVTGFGSPMLDYDYPQDQLREMVEYAKQRNNLTIIKRS